MRDMKITKMLEKIKNAINIAETEASSDFSHETYRDPMIGMGFSRHGESSFKITITTEKEYMKICSLVENLMYLSRSTSSTTTGIFRLKVEVIIDDELDRFTGQWHETKKYGCRLEPVT
jgi:hypothetical protein